jgi:hypothetical protein
MRGSSIKHNITTVLSLQNTFFLGDLIEIFLALKISSRHSSTTKCVLTMNNLTFLVHPPLALHLHPLCKDVIERFQQCHQQNLVGKFFGACNDLRTELDNCLYEEVA